MLFSSLIFLVIFLPGVLFIYFVLLRGRKVRNVFLLFASLFFYAWGEPRFILVMLVSIAGNYLFGLLVHRYRERKRIPYLIIALSVIANLSLLFYCKYVDFFISNANLLFGLEWPLREIVLPIGISFFTFQAMSYVFDVYRGKGTVQRNPLNVALYVAFFPQLVAGPIIRYETVAEQINNRTESWNDFEVGLRRFIMGLGKKVLLANNLACIADKAFSIEEYSSLSVSFALLGAVSYSLQIYYDFSGYSDMAIGLGRMFGFKFLENFEYPYISKSISEFWRRWHISLGSWFRDYVYFPLGGSRVHSRTRLIFNLFLVWFLTGLWHGANWTFVGWGLAYFLLISFEKITSWPSRFTKIWQVLCYRIFTILYVIANWILFRSEGIGQAIQYFKSIFGMNGNHLVDSLTFLYIRENALFLVFAIVLAIPVFPWLKRKMVSIRPGVGQSIIMSIGHVGLLVLFFICLTYLVKGSYNPFIYFNF